MFSNMPNISVDVGKVAFVLFTLSPLLSVATNLTSPEVEPKPPLKDFAKLKKAPSAPAGLPVIACE